MGYELAIEKYPGLISREGLRVPSAYDSETETEEEEEEEQPGPSKASPYPIKIKWDRDSDGYWKLAKITTSTPKMKGKSVQETGACANLTQDIPEGAASADMITVTDDDDEDFKKGIIRWPQKNKDGEQDEQERRFSAARETAGKYRDPLKEFFSKTGSLWTQLRPGSPHNFCPETEAEHFQMSDQADQAARYSDGHQDPPRPANRYPKRWRQVIRQARKKSEKDAK